MKHVAFRPGMVVLALGVGLVSACAVPLSPIPMTSVSTSGEVMRGFLTPNMGFSSQFSLAAEDGSRTCDGTTRSDGTGAMTCSDGRSYTISVPRPPYGRFHGSYVEQLGEERVAVGWGNRADPAAWRPLLD